MQLVAALIVDRARRARLESALRGRAATLFVECGGELSRTVASRPVAAVITEPRDREGVSTAACIQALREGFPSVPVIGYCAAAGAGPGDVLALARAGVSEIILRDFDDVGVGLRAALASAEHTCTAERVMGDLAPCLAGEVRTLLTCCLEQSRESLTVEQLARALGVHRRTLVHRLARAGLPSPIVIIGWCRLLLAARQLEDPGRPVEQIALALDFPSGAAFRNMLRRYTGLRPNEVRENGGLACVLHLFKRRLAERPRELAAPAPR